MHTLDTFYPMKWTLLLGLFGFSTYINGQWDDRKSVQVKYFDQAIEPDGVLDEEIWSQITPTNDFWQYFPTDSLKAKNDTDIYLYSDDNNLYIGIRCHGVGNKYVVTSLKRDFRAGGQDNITFIFDTFNDKTNAFFFGINPQGVNREGLITNGGNVVEDFSGSWDNRWFGDAQIYDTYYTAELVIPFSSIRFKDNAKTWGLMAYRFDTQANENTVWNRIPRNQILFNLAFTGEMNFEKAPKMNGANMAIIPYVSTVATKTFNPAAPTDFTFEAGGDLKVGITSGLNLDVTVNPDFSQVEVDQQVTNVNRFEIFFPERRQFFLENEDLFGGFGFDPMNPFFSRRIGVGIDTATGTNVQNKILAGMRLSGKIGSDTRVGLLNMQTASDEIKGLPSTNYSVAVIQQKILKRSNIGGIFVNKQVSGDKIAGLGINRYNRVAGIDFNYASADNTLTGKVFGHTSFTAGQNQKNISHGAFMAYSVRAFGLEWNHQYIDENFNAEVGFVPRKNLFRIGPNGSLNFYPQNDFISDFSFGVDTEILYRPGFGKSDHQFSLSFESQFANTSRFTLFLNHEYVYLFDDFDPTGTEALQLTAGTDYTYKSLSARFASDSRQAFSFSLGTSIGQYFNGQRLGLNGNIRWQYPPMGFLSIDYSYNEFDMPYLENKRRNYLIGPRIDYTFSKSVFFTTFIQYNSQTANTNINARLQWRFAPVSDFYLVYTDNYLTGDIYDPERRFAFDVQNRSVVAKLSYWLNI